MGETLDPTIQVQTKESNHPLKAVIAACDDLQKEIISLSNSFKVALRREACILSVIAAADSCVVIGDGIVQEAASGYKKSQGIDEGDDYGY